MATQEEKDLETKRKVREKELRILKAQNEMLEDVKQSVLAHQGWKEEDNMDGVIAEIESAQKDNLQMAMAYHQASAEEVESVNYGKASQKSIDDYNRHLKVRNLTDEMMHNKAFGVNAVVSSADTQQKTKRERRNRKKNEDNLKTNVQQQSPQTQENVNNTPVFVSNPIRHKNNVDCGEWDLSNVPDYIQFDIIPLPSHGECYPIDSPLRSGVIPISYLTASDENLIHSPNMYRDGKIIDVIISRKILDKRITASDLCKGDRDAITLWLRATGYGDNFPIVVHNPNDKDKTYNTSINLSDLNYLKFNLKGDENGLFDYITSNGDVFKFKQITKRDEDYLRTLLTEQLMQDTKVKIFDAISDVKYYFEQIKNQNFDEKEDIQLDIDEIVDWSNSVDVVGDNGEDVTFNIITEGMILRTVSINGIDSEDYIKGYIENMKAQDAYEYRMFMEQNTPGVNYQIKVNIPESDGGGSFDTFLRIDELIFRNV